VRYFEARATVTGKGATGTLDELEVHEFDMSAKK
jgi:hypothetical protein